MGGCAASKLQGGEEEVVSICRERKRMMKLAVERRYALAAAHCNYSHSLYAVSAALKLFVARHSSPSSPFLITFPPPSYQDPNLNISNPILLHQKPSDFDPTPTQEVLPSCHHSTTSSSSSSGSDADEEQVGEREEQVHQQQHLEQGFRRAQTPPPAIEVASCGGYLYMGMGMPSPQRDFGWDFFNPFLGVRPEVVGGFPARNNPNPNPEEDDFKVVREEEGIPELEEEEGTKQAEEEKLVVVGPAVIDNQKNAAVAPPHQVVVSGPVADAGPDMGQGEKGLTVIDTPARGRELLDALKDIEDHFLRAYDSAKHVSRMLEAKKVQLSSGLDEIKENSTKLIQAITWHRSHTLGSSSCKSLVASSSKNSSSWTECKNELFDGDAGMAAGSHSLTLGRLYAWEKKLYEEVKEGDNIRKLYEKKCSQLRNKHVRGDDTLSLDKSRAGIKDLYSRILVAIRRAESISEKIHKLTTEELEPQILELLHGFAQSWKIMLESHQTQNMIIFQVKTYECPTYGKFCSDSHRLATLQLEAEIRNWRECFHEYIAAQRSYAEALHGWLSKFIVPEAEFCSRGRSSIPPFRANGPPLYTVCHDWLSAMENMPDKMVSISMRSFVKGVRALWVQQGEEQEQKRKVEKLAKELDKKMLSYQKAESRIHEPKLLGYNMDTDVKNEDSPQRQADHLMEKKESLESLRRRLDAERERHNNCIQETQRMTLNGFQTGFGSIFDSLVQFAKSCLNMYNNSAIATQSLGKDGNRSCLQGSHGKEDDGS